MTANRFTPFSLNLRGQLTVVDRPQVMGIINATPDSFFSPSRVDGADEAARRAERLIAEGADMIDVGACSTRPGSVAPDTAEEMSRLREALRGIRMVDNKIPVSVDTFRADVAAMAVEEMGADIVNDISAGLLDNEMIATVARLRVPYIAMHTRGDSRTMTSLTDYPDGVAVGVAGELSERLAELRLAGVADVIVDPGFGFAKTVEQNYELLNDLPHLSATLRAPLLVGVSRKSMVTRALDITADQSLSAVTALHLAALERGAAILRVHDPAEARQAVKLFQLLTR